MGAPLEQPVRRKRGVLHGALTVEEQGSTYKYGWIAAVHHRDAASHACIAGLALEEPRIGCFATTWGGGCQGDNVRS